MSDFHFKANGLITLTTDFGLSDPYVGTMKGAILARYSAARLVDLTHQIPDYQPQLAGFWLARIWPHFPDGTVHLAVVDPGVGTARGMVLLQVARQVFVAPDNGLLAPVAQSAADTQWRIFTLDDLAHLQLRPASHTFHGRDIFAPLVAEIAANRQVPSALGRTEPRQSPPARQPGCGHIVWVDRYGNLITDIEADHLRCFASPIVRFRGQQIPLLKSYGFGPPGQLLGLVNSWGTLEIALAQGNAQKHLQARLGEAVQVAEIPLSGHPMG